MQGERRRRATEEGGEIREVASEGCGNVKGVKVRTNETKRKWMRDEGRVVHKRRTNVINKEVKKKLDCGRGEGKRIRLKSHFYTIAKSNIIVKIFFLIFKYLVYKYSVFKQFFFFNLTYQIIKNIEKTKYIMKKKQGLDTVFKKSSACRKNCSGSCNMYSRVSHP